MWFAKRSWLLGYGVEEGGPPSPSTPRDFRTVVLRAPWTDFNNFWFSVKFMGWRNFYFFFVLRSDEFSAPCVSSGFPGNPGSGFRDYGSWELRRTLWMIRYQVEWFISITNEFIMTMRWFWCTGWNLEFPEFPGIPGIPDFTQCTRIISWSW